MPTSVVNSSTQLTTFIHFYKVVLEGMEDQKIRMPRGYRPDWSLFFLFFALRPSQKYCCLLKQMNPLDNKSDVAHIVPIRIDKEEKDILLRSIRILFDSSPRLQGANIVNLYVYGSHLHDCATKESDHDFVAVVEAPCYFAGIRRIVVWMHYITKEYID